MEELKITRCTGAGAKMADQLSKAHFRSFRETAAAAGWALQLEPARIPPALLRWLDRPVPDDQLGARILHEIGASRRLAGYSA
jgi:hypothetical protein